MEQHEEVERGRETQTDRQTDRQTEQRRVVNEATRRGGERERERERERDTHTHTDRDIDRDSQTDRRREREREKSERERLYYTGIKTRHECLPTRNLSRVMEVGDGGGLCHYNSSWTVQSGPETHPLYQHEIIYN